MDNGFDLSIGLQPCQEFRESSVEIQILGARARYPNNKQVGGRSAMSDGAKWRRMVVASGDNPVYEARMQQCSQSAAIRMYCQPHLCARNREEDEDSLSTA